MKVTIHRGTHEIGGSCVEISHEKTRIVLDIGMPLVKPDGSRFNMSLHKNLSGSELVESGILPRISGFYQWDTASAAIDGLLISHAHYDHYGFAGYLRNDIPCYLGEGTRRLMEISAIFSGHDSKVGHHKIIESGKPVQIGTITITPCLMDHSAFDSYAFLLEAGGKKLLYSGDFRDHGRKPYALPRLLHALPKSIDAMILEGTMIGRKGAPKKEKDIESELYDLFKKTPYLMMIAASGQNIDRLVSVYRASKRSDRLFVIDPYVATVLEQLSELAKLPHPSAAFNDIKVFFPYSLCHRLKRNENETLFKRFARFKISREAICRQPDKITMFIRPSILDYLERMKNLQGATVVWSQWEGYLHDGLIEKFRDFMTKKEMNLISIHTSGHASIETMKEVVAVIKPKKIIPIHTSYPRSYSNLYDNSKIIYAQDGIEFSI